MNAALGRVAESLHRLDSHPCQTLYEASITGKAVVVLCIVRIDEWSMVNMCYGATTVCVKVIRNTRLSLLDLGHTVPFKRQIGHIRVAPENLISPGEWLK